MKKTGKSRIILSSVSVLLVLSLLAGMTMAWFTDTEKVNANFTAGVLDISVNPGDTEVGKPMSFENLRPMTFEAFNAELQSSDEGKWTNNVGANGMAPGDYDPVPAYFKPVVITNEGTLPTKVQLSMELDETAVCETGERQFDPDDMEKDKITAVTPQNPICKNLLKDVLKIFVYKDVDGTWKQVDQVNLNTRYDETIAKAEDEEFHTYTTAKLAAGETARYVIAGYLPELVGNPYQGKHFHGNLVARAYQMDTDEGGKPDEGGNTPVNPFEENLTVRFVTGTGDKVDEIKTSLKEAGNYTISNDDYDAPAYYFYTPAKQSTEVVVHDTGKAEPDVVDFIVEENTTLYTVHYLNVEDGNREVANFGYTLSLMEQFQMRNDGAVLNTETAKVASNLPAGYVFSEAPQTRVIKMIGGQVQVDGANTHEVYFYVKPEGSQPETITKDVVVRWNTADGTEINTSYTAKVMFAEGAASAELKPDTATLDSRYELADPADSKTINLVNGEADPKEVVFTVKPKAEYQVRVDFQNRETGVTLDQEYSVFYNALADGVHTFTPVDAAQDGTDTMHYVAPPADYEYDPAASTQSPQFVTVPNDNGTQVVIFTVKLAGSGTDPDNPDCPHPEYNHIIRTAEDLNNVRYHPHCKFELANDIDLSTAYPNWTPISELKSSYDPWNGTTYEPTENVFTGTLDGNGYSITGLNVGTLKSFNGLFSYSSGTIHNLKLTGTVNAHSNSGILVGWNAGAIENCTVDGSITAGSQTANVWEVGGIVGWNDTTGRISGCTSNANVSGNPAYMGYQAASHYYYGGVSGSNNGTITNCCSTGTVKGARAGGLLGYNSGTITNCYTTSKVYALIDTYGNTDTWTHPTIGQLDGGTVGKTNIFFQKGNLYRNNQLYTGWDTDKYRGLGKTETEMKTAATYTDAGWDTSVWNIADGSYPTLK